jgi:GTP-binding protein HflX
LILNKIDRVSPEERGHLRREYPHAIQLSALNPDDVAMLKQRLVDHFDDSLVEVDIAVPHSRVGPVLGYVHEHMRIGREQWDGWGARLRLKGLAEDAAHVKSLAGDEVAPPFDDGAEA